LRSTTPTTWSNGSGLDSSSPGDGSSSNSGTSFRSREGGRHGMLQQIPSNPTDFPGNHPTAIQVHVTSANKDMTGTYHVRGEITNNGNTTLNSVMVTVHFCGAKGQLVDDSSCCYTTPINIDPGHTATVDNFAMANKISDEPVS
jgi:hypothetical protein